MHPSALAIVIDAHERRGVTGDDKSKKYVIGTLMGSNDGSHTFIDQAFVVNYEMRQQDDNRTVFQLDKQHQAEMLGLTQAATPDQSVIGWFSTGNDEEFTELDKLMYDYYSMEAQKANAPSFYLAHKKQTYNRPLFLRVNVQILREKKHNLTELPIQAYLPETFNMVQDEDGSVQYDLMWSELNISIGCGNAERTALNMINGCTNTDDRDKPLLKLDAVGSNLDPLNNLTGDMINRIDTVQAYISKMLESGESLNEGTGRMLSEIFSGVPGLDQEQLEKMLNGELTDLLMVTYLSQLATVQLTLNDKLKNSFAQTPESAEKKIMGKNKRTTTLGN
jgi:hypothetical protein